MLNGKNRRQVVGLSREANPKKVDKAAYLAQQIKEGRLPKRSTKARRLANAYVTLSLAVA